MRSDSIEFCDVVDQSASRRFGERGDYGEYGVGVGTGVSDDGLGCG